MGDRVIVKQVGGVVIGTIGVDASGRVTITGADVPFAEDLELVVKRLLAHPVDTLGGDIVRGPAGRTFRTVATPAQPGEAGFLQAMADSITRSSETIGGRALRAWVERTSCRE